MAKEKRHWMEFIYGLTLSDVAKIFDKQNKACAICKNVNAVKYCIDHNHKTGEIRGILCYKCNSLLGCAKDDVEILQSAIKYLSGKPIVLSIFDVVIESKDGLNDDQKANAR